MRRPGHLYPPTATERTISVQSQNRHNYCSYILQRGFTATPARCWAALYGVDCVSVLAAKAVSLSRAHHLSACLSHVSTSGAIVAAATANHRRLSKQIPTKSCFIGRAWPIFPAFDGTCRKNPNKKVFQVCTVGGVPSRRPRGRISVLPEKGSI